MSKIKKKRTTKEKLLALADYLEKKVRPGKLTMEAFSCGTKACVAGWGVKSGIFTECKLGPVLLYYGVKVRYLEPKKLCMYPYDPGKALTEELPELSPAQLEDLFFSGGGSRREKAQELRRVARSLP